MKSNNKRQSDCYRLLSTVVSVALLFFGSITSSSAEEDLQFWMPLQVIHPLTEKLDAYLQAEIRLQDDIMFPATRDIDVRADSTCIMFISRVV